MAKKTNKSTSAPLPAAKGLHQRNEALRANLSKRKQQSRDRNEQEK